MQLTQHGIISTVRTNLSEQQKVSLSGRTTLLSYGDSFTAGQNASTTANRYINQFATNKSLTLSFNDGAGGRGVWYAASTIQIRTFTRSSTVITFMAGLNDIRRNGAAVKTLNKIESALSSIILKCLSGAGSVGSGASGVTRSGSFTAFSASSVGGLKPATGGIPGEVASFTNADNAYWEYTFVGTSVGVQLIGNSGDTDTYGIADIYIDGVLQESVNLNDKYDNVTDGTYDNRRGPVARMYFGLTNASHTLKVARRNGSGTVVVDYFSGPLNAPSTSTLLLAADVPYLNSTGWALSPSSGSDEVARAASEVIRKTLEPFRSRGYPFAAVNTMDYYNVSTGIDSDNIHPNDTGHDQIDLAFRAACL